jgi:hypothetical protein
MLYGEGSDGEFSSRFPPLFATFLKPNKILSRRPCRPPSLSQSREQRPATTIPTSEVCGEGGDIEFPFLVFHYFKCFLTAFFSIKLLFSGWLGLLFFIFISPPHLNFTMSYVPIKKCQPKLLFCVVNKLHKLEYSLMENCLLQ